MGIITLITDFGNQDAYAGVMQGVILGITPQTTIVTISHCIDPQDLVQAAFLIRSSYRFFPEKTVHAVVVDPGVGTGRAVLAFELEGHIFLGPDNGVLSLVRDIGHIGWLVAVDNPEMFRQPISDTFHGRDIFAPVAAHLINGVVPTRLGSPMDPSRMVDLDYQPSLMKGDNELIGRVIDVDRFGNLVSDIDVQLIDSLQHHHPEKPLVVAVGDHLIEGMATTFMDRRRGDFVAYIGSRKFLEIAVNQGNAAKRLQIGKSAPIKVTLAKPRVKSSLSAS